MSDQMDEVQVKRLFMLLHGMYGNKVLDAYRIGQVDANGEDMGVATARSVWLNGLREFDRGVVMAALAKVTERNKTWPPTLPEFREACKAAAPRKWNPPQNVPQIEMSATLRSEYVQRSRDAIAKSRAKRAGAMEVSDGLPGLCALIAAAVGHAGGDEIAALRRLDEAYARKA
ncbi:hypothetical protein E5S69_31610 [Cupriavidus necator]|uniref:hypothetical protein n=1 Tax=Cupriavidus necator TaxID=106590 RepID=UPI00148FBF3B|nr:hypothetical protein [Cupriavidus necator]NOV28035.1 hypothetical protein [Cupriavidus necator]